MNQYLQNLASSWQHLECMLCHYFGANRLLALSPQVPTGGMSSRSFHHLVSLMSFQGMRVMVLNTPEEGEKAPLSKEKQEVYEGLLDDLCFLLFVQYPNPWFTVGHLEGLDRQVTKKCSDPLQQPTTTHCLGFHHQIN